MYMRYGDSFPFFFLLLGQVLVSKQPPLHAYPSKDLMSVAKTSRIDVEKSKSDRETIATDVSGAR
jgi:hypothetical protein